MKMLTETFQKTLETIMKIVAAMMRMLGLGGGSGERQIAPKAPTREEANADVASAEKGADLARKLGLTPVEKLVTYIGLSNEQRKNFDLTGLSPIQQAWLKAADEKTLEKMSKMDTGELAKFFMHETAQAKRAMTMPLPKKLRDAIDLERSEAAQESAPEARRPKRKEREPARSFAPSPRFAMAM